MKITSVTIVRRRTHGPYEHEEITAHAELTTDRPHLEQLIELRRDIETALYGQIEAKKVEVNEAPVAETTPAPVKEKTTRQRAKPAQEAKTEETPKVETNEAGQEIPPVIPTQEEVKETSKVVGSVDTKNVSTVQQKESVAAPSTVGKGIVAYDSTVKEHRSRFATYLGETFPNWTPDKKFGKETNSPEKAAYATAVQNFSKGLHGKPFEDAKGNMLDSFKAELASFFGK